MQGASYLFEALGTALVLMPLLYGAWVSPPEHYGLRIVTRVTAGLTAAWLGIILGHAAGIPGV